MTWIKLDDGFFDNAKVIAAGTDAQLLYVAGLCFSSRNLTDGRIPGPAVKRLTDLKNPARAAAALVSVGLWLEDGDDYLVHDYEKHQRSAADVVGQREAGKARSKRSRERKANADRTFADRSRDVRAIEVEVERESEKPMGTFSHSRELVGVQARKPEKAKAKLDPLVARILEHFPEIESWRAHELIDTLKFERNIANMLIDAAIGQAIERHATDRLQNPAAYIERVATDWYQQRVSA